MKNKDIRLQGKISKSQLNRLKKLLKHGIIYDLGQPYHNGMPHHPLHPPFLFSLTRKHGDYMYEGGVSAASEIFTMGGHVGTHLDSLAHISKEGKLFSGIEAARIQGYHSGINKLGIDQMSPILARGVLLDVAKFRSVKVLDSDYTITPNDLEKTMISQKISIEKNDIALIRTGWANYWNRPKRFVSNLRGTPGPNLDAARWLSSRKVFLVGSDTLAFEKMPSSLPVHAFLLAHKGIYIIEMLNLEELSRNSVFEFIFIVSPLRIKGGTASPVRPFAIV